MADESKVDIDALVEFSGDVWGLSPKRTQPGGMAMDFLHGMAGPQAKVNGAIMGYTGTNEAQTLQDWYTQACLVSLNKFGNDVSTGFMALGSAVVVMAANYRQGDVSQAEAMNDVMEAFSPGKGDRTLAGWLASAPRPEQDARAKAQTDPHLPPPQQDPLAACPGAPHPGPQTPADQVNEHNAKYANRDHPYEDWYPGNPDYDPMKHPNIAAM
jgi:hypothetical protein